MTLIFFWIEQKCPYKFEKKLNKKKKKIRVFFFEKKKLIKKKKQTKKKIKPVFILNFLIFFKKFKNLLSVFLSLGRTLTFFCSLRGDINTISSLGGHWKLNDNLRGICVLFPIIINWELTY
jgi:hypothetical protein